MIHPQVQALIDAEEGADPPSLEAARARYLELALERGGPAEPVDEVEDIVIPRDADSSIPARRYVPLHGTRVEGRLVWIHGGGWILGDIPGFDHVCRALANAGGMQVVSVDYRLAPEHPFPAPLDDAVAAARWAVDSGDPVVLGGDSAGGNLAAVAARHVPGLRAQVLVYPATDATMDGASYREAPPMLSAEAMQACWAAYRGETPAEDPDISPLYADLGGVPPAFVAVAHNDVLRSDGEAYAEALRGAGVAVEFENFEDMTHGFLRWGGVVDRSRELIERIGAYAAAALKD